MKVKKEQETSVFCPCHLSPFLQDALMGAMDAATSAWGGGRKLKTGPLPMGAQNVPDNPQKSPKRRLIFGALKA